ncbi:MAG: hypothetical protein IPK53_19385 [bacterium]|nr:hypothetical protein [bacterium]
MGAFPGQAGQITPIDPLGERAVYNPLGVFWPRGWERPLIGRDTEPDLCWRSTDAALRNVGGVAAILGAVGVGKTRLLAEGIRYWLTAGARAWA